MDEVIRIKDRWGNDATPLCMDDDFVCTKNIFGNCNYASECPGFYRGCYADWRRMKRKEKHSVKF